MITLSTVKVVNVPKLVILDCAAVLTVPVRSPSNVVATTVPAVPEKTSELLDASGINVNFPVESSKPKNPILAADPLCHLNSIPLSLLSSDPGAVSPPRVRIGSSIVTTVELTVVVVPPTVKSPLTTKPPVTVAPVLSRVRTSSIDPSVPSATLKIICPFSVPSLTSSCFIRIRAN